MANLTKNNENPTKIKVTQMRKKSKYLIKMANFAENKENPTKIEGTQMRKASNIQRISHKNG